MDFTDIDQLLYDLFSGKCSSEELAELKKWLDADSKNQLYFQKYKKDYLHLRWGIRSNLIQGDFKQFCKRLEQRRKWLWTRRIAAVVSLLFLIGGGIGLYHFSIRPPMDSSKAMSRIISPGRPQAILELSSGEQIKLDTIFQEMQEEDGVAICVSSAGKVSYSFSDTLHPSKNLYNRLSIPKGGEYALQLSDGTKVWLNAATEFRYPIYFSGDCREVYLKGEAYFEVATDSTTPFIVKADELEVKVYGTQFNVNNYRSNRTEVVLAEGAIGMKIRDQEIRLKPGQKGEVKTGTILVEDVDVASYIAWKDGDFIFENERLEDIMNKLSRWYDVEIFYQRDKVRDIRLSGDMKRYKDIQTLLYYFERISEVRFSVQERNILVK